MLLKDVKVCMLMSYGFFRLRVMSTLRLIWTALRGREVAVREAWINRVVMSVSIVDMYDRKYIVLL